MKNTDRQLLFINYETFLSIAWKAFFQVQQLVNIKRTKKVVTDDDVDQICIYNAEIQRQSITSILFCTMTLEAYINNYGMTNQSRSFFDNYLDKLDLKSKWIIIPRLITGKQIKTESKAFNYLTNLISIRNKLVHIKTKKDNTSTPEWNNWLWEDDTFEALECVKFVINELKAIDNNVTTDWIEHAKNAPYA